MTYYFFYQNRTVIHKLILSVGFFITTFSYSQSNYQKFKTLSSPLKWWVILHPFKAKRALRISENAKKISDSICKTNLLDKDPSGGQVDAFRHAYWMATLNQCIGKRAALSLGRAYEKDNYITYTKQRLEDGNIPDKASMKMDLFNNSVGVTLTTKNLKTSKNGLIYKIINAISDGRMKVIKKDNKGNFLTCNDKVIDKNSLKGKWENNKCLIKSNTIKNKK